MSVMMLEPAAIGQLVAWAEEEMVHAGSCRATAYRMMACNIVEINYAAYVGRYDQKKDNAAIQEVVIQICGQARRAYDEYKKGIARVDAAVIFQFAKSIGYQCCEEPRYQKGAPVREFMERVKAKAADKMMYEILGEAAQDAWAPDDLVGVGKKVAA